MAGYTRQSTYTDGDIIQASDSNNEFDQLVNAFANTTGHAHDGTAGEGPVIKLIGDAGDATPTNKVEVDTANSRVGFYIDVSGSAVEQLRVQDGAILPVTDSDVDLGSSSLYFKDTYTDTVTTTGNVSVGGNLSVTGNATISGNLTFGDAVTDTVSFGAEIDSDFVPEADGTYDLGSSTQEWQDLFIDGTAKIDTLTVDENATVTGNLTVNGNTTLGNADTDTVTVTADVASDLIPSADGTYDLGAVGSEWQDLFIDGTANIDSLVADTADINAGTIDNTAIGGTTPAAGAFTTLSASSNATVTGNLTVNGNTTIGNADTDTVTVTADVASNLIPSTDDTYDLGASGSEWKDLYLDGTANVDTLVIGASTGVTSVDTDLSSVSASDDTLASAKAIKTYVDAQVTAQDLDFQADTGGALNIDLDSETLTFTGGTGIDTSGSGNAVTFAIDSTVATLSGTQTLTNKTLTTPVIGQITNTGTLTLPTSTDTLVGRATTDTLTNKSIDADNNTVTNLEVDNLKSGVLDTDLSTVSASDDTLASAKAIKTYVDAQVTAQDLDLTTDSGTIAIDLDSETLTVAGTTNEIETSATGNTVTIGLPNSITVSGTMTATTFSGDLNGTINTATTATTQTAGTNNTTVATTAYSETAANNAAVALSIALG